MLIIFGIFLIRDNSGLSSYSNDSLPSISDSIEEENDSINAKLDSNIVFYDFLTQVSDGKINRHIAWDYNKMVSIDFVDADITKKSDGYNIKAYVVQVGGDFETPDEYLYEIDMYMSADAPVFKDASLDDLYYQVGTNGDLKQFQNGYKFWYAWIEDNQIYALFEQHFN